LDLVRLPFVAGKQGSAGRLGDRNLDRRTREFEHFARTGEGAAGAIAGDEPVQAFASEVRKNFRAGGVAMPRRVGEVLELAGEKGAVLLGKLLGAADHASGALRAGRENDLGAQATHQFASLNGKCFRHEGHERVATHGADHRQCHAGISRGRFDHGLTGFKLAALLGVENDRQCQSILDRAHRVEGLDLDVHADAIGCQAIDAHDGRASDGVENAVVNHADFQGIRRAARHGGAIGTCGAAGNKRARHTSL